jgi:hypothetical protein
LTTFSFFLSSDQEREKEDITISSNDEKESKMEGNTTDHCVNYTLAPPESVVPSSSRKGSATGLVVDWLNTFNFFDSKLEVLFFMFFRKLELHFRMMKTSLTTLM